MGRSFVVDASPLILLSRVGRLDLLAALAESVVVPEAVVEELHAGAHHDDAYDAVAREESVHLVESLEVPDRIRLWDLGAGESQVLAFALAHQGFEAVVDDLRARRCAGAVGVPVVGTVGVVLLCKRTGILAVARPVLEALRDAGMYLGDDVFEIALSRVGE